MTDESGVRTRPPALSSNGVPVLFDEATFAPMRDSSRWRGDPERLRQVFAEDGYLLLRDVLDRDLVLRARAAYFERFASAMFATGTARVDGVFSGAEPTDLPEYGTPGHPAYDFVRSAEFDAFTRDARLAEVCQVLLDAPATMLPRRILRHFHSGRARASRAHVDYDYMDRGSDQVLTAWIPLGDCPIECGGLIYLEGSHRVARGELERLRPYTDRPADPRPLSNDLALTASQLGGRWLWTDYRAGDVVLHSPHTVHASLDDVSDVMRVSVDIRFCRSGAIEDERWHGAWSADDGY